ncbi:dehydrogenase [Pseudarthrobacter sulfonivorans]|uniref:Dehydrogenase n=1 Tax=Pseudarthrobacter sulfonivorans TaxID=121292 RepID=A0A0U3P7T7_9MICC|nr:NAD(P)-dependent oxidoreductase [Pseudarthrobacter sulfonivorans]ALV41376.1 dehydrogenase [Pseudarthrobacter sulfonivorans]
MAFTVGISPDFLDSDGNNVWGDIGLAGLDDAGLNCEYMKDGAEVLTPAQLERYDAILYAAPAVMAESFAGVTNPPLILARFGVGFDAVDLQACTRAGTVATITPDGARGPVATATLSMLLSVLHNTVLKDRLVREKSWDRRESFMGTGLTGKTIGLLGVGNTGGELIRLLQPFGVRYVGHDPFCPPERARELGVELMELGDVATECDALIVMAVLTEQTRHIVNAAILERMKSTAVVINMARGPIINEQDLISALAIGSIAGAGLDVFEQEPVTNELIGMDNVTLSPHCLSWTDEMSLGNGSSCVRAIVNVANGRTPEYVINRDVLETVAFKERLALRVG